MPRHGTLASICALLLWFGGCPKRQETRSVVVYVPPQPPAPSTPAEEKPQVLVIAEPAPPPAPEAVTPPPSGETAGNGAQTGKRRRPAPAEADQTSTQDNPEPAPAVEVPALEPRESSAQQAELRGQYAKLEQDIRQRLARLTNAQLSANERKTLEDARTFFAQAAQALASGDLPRALNLARKASLLLAALE